MSSEYDFIVIGAGPAGCAIATRHAKSSSKPSVLLVEAGGDNKDAAYLVPADRFNLAFSQPQLNWGYKTAPQTHLKGQEIDYSRGKGLGGYEDFDEWAKKVGDDTWKWKKVKERFKKIENYHVDIPREHQKYISPKAENHGTTGPLNLSYADIWEKGLSDVFVAAEEVGLTVNPDINSGNPIGMGMGATCAYKGERTTASSYLQLAPSNLEFALNTIVAKVLLDGKKATGIKTVEGKEFFAKKDIILSGGALNSPQLLMLSGIGPADELQKHDIPLVHESPEAWTNDRMTFETDAEAVAAARAQHTKDKTGMMNSIYGGVPMGWFKSDAVYASEEFKALDKHTQEHLKKPTIPSFEIATHTPPLFVGDYELQPTDSYLTALAFVMNPQSYGEVTLTSANPLDSPKSDPRLVSQPYDRRVLIEGVRQMMDYLEAPVFKKNTVKMIGCPKSRSDEDIWDHCSGNIFSSWHMCSTTRMGKKGDEGAVVDTDFRGRGVQNLRVADLSVLPLLPNNHTQSTAYLVGETAAEKIIAEYGL
ncbi:related to alcohol oxidase [Rhynchosporium secalis]|uniref:Related to alcohol oxidase n=1 Tax=Rhynchosporium secalis TaxID=38038 RepID=A0A1E1MG37_RHYSE|nr:related to alcohol oxidase [Rhynchosporium secalis]